MGALGGQILTSRRERGFGPTGKHECEGRRGPLAGGYLPNECVGLGAKDTARQTWIWPMFSEIFGSDRSDRGASARQSVGRSILFMEIYIIAF